LLFYGVHFAKRRGAIPHAGKHRSIRTFGIPERSAGSMLYDLL
jgi:hypothetical protein